MKIKFKKKKKSHRQEAGEQINFFHTCSETKDEVGEESQLCKGWAFLILGAVTLHPSWDGAL